MVKQYYGINGPISETDIKQVATRTRVSFDQALYLLQLWDKWSARRKGYAKELGEGVLASKDPMTIEAVIAALGAA
jgi:hypothetical protein